MALAIYLSLSDSLTKMLTWILDKNFSANLIFKRKMEKANFIFSGRVSSTLQEVSKLLRYFCGQTATKRIFKQNFPVDSNN